MTPSTTDQNNRDVRIRAATSTDTGLILSFIRELAEYEKLSHEVVADEAGLAQQLFGPTPRAEVLIAEVDGEPAGFALFFHNFSTFRGKPGLYLEDLFVRPTFRGLGLGKRLMVRLAQIALERDCGRFEWWVLDWNTPAVDFYRRLGAEGMDEWTVQRVTGEALRALAAQPD
jgi:GNAT superfamily N-acetyltransferase